MASQKRFVGFNLFLLKNLLFWKCTPRLFFFFKIFVDPKKEGASRPWGRQDHGDPKTMGTPRKRGPQDHGDPKLRLELICKLYSKWNISKSSFKIYTNFSPYVHMALISSPLKVLVSHHIRGLFSLKIYLTKQIHKNRKKSGKKNQLHTTR